MQASSRLLVLFSDLLDYPALNLSQSVNECMCILSRANSSSAEELAGFQHWAEKEPLNHVEETYTSTFDLQGNCCPYVGHHLFGDNYQRSWFMARLNHGYLEKDFSCGNELPDHIMVILRFLALNTNDEFSKALWEEGLLPSVEKMVEAFGDDCDHPYGKVIKSLLLLLQDDMDRRKDTPTASEIGGLGNA